MSLHTTIDYSPHVLRQAVRVFQEMKIKIRDIFQEQDRVETREIDTHERYEV